MDTLSEPDRVRFTSQCSRLEVAKASAEFFGHRPRRFVLLTSGEAIDQLPTGAKRIHLIRHGEGYHNVWRNAEFAAGRKPYAKRNNMEQVPSELFDPHLTATGRAEAQAAHVKAQVFTPQLLVTSPLRRAIETLLIAFDHAVTTGTPCIAHELCREEIKGTPAGEPSIYDAHLPCYTLAVEFPQINFDRYVLRPEDGPEGEKLRGDPLWWHCASPFGACRAGETDAALSERAWRFLCWLMSQPEREIAVATHSIFLLAFFHGALDPADNVKWDGPQLFRTGELRSVTIIESAEPAMPADEISGSGSILAGSGYSASVKEMRQM